MAEKRGFTGKLTYDFPVEGVLEVQTVSGDWARVTAISFRSFDGPRRITKPSRQPNLGHKDADSIKFIEIEYDGPVYLYGTNKKVRKKGIQRTRRN